MRVEPVEQIDPGDRFVILYDLRELAQASGVPDSASRSRALRALKRKVIRQHDLSTTWRRPRQSRRAAGVAMSQENVDLVQRRTIGAFNSGDWDASLELTWTRTSNGEPRTPYLIKTATSAARTFRAFWAAWTDKLRGLPSGSGRADRRGGRCRRVTRIHWPRHSPVGLRVYARIRSHKLLACVTGKSAGGRYTTVRRDALEAAGLRE